MKDSVRKLLLDMIKKETAEVSFLFAYYDVIGYSISIACDAAMQDR